MYKINLDQNAENDLEKLDPQIARRIADKIHFYSKQKNPLRFAKHLKDHDLGKYRFRIGKYRAAFDIHKNNIIHILYIRHRKESY